MKQNKLLIVVLLAAFVVLLSLPYLVPHMGWTALFALVPLLCAERIASQMGVKRFFWWYFLASYAFTAATTWWVCKATVGGGLFACFVNAFWISLIFSLFRVSRKRLSGAVPYIFLAVMWVAWEKWSLDHAQICFPWILLGNAFARTTSLVQWYEVTGTLGGSLWVLASNLSIFGVMVSLSDGRWFSWTSKARSAASLGLALVVLGPVAASEFRYFTYQEQSEGTMEVTIAQSNFDPYLKFHGYTQAQQNDQVLGLFREELKDRYRPQEYPSNLRLLMLPETFTSDIWLNDVSESPTWQSFQALLKDYPNTNLLFGASAHKYFSRKVSIQCRKSGQMWYESYNTAFMTDPSGRVDYRNKMKLVVGTELTPYPKFFAPLDDKLGGLMGRCVTDSKIKLLQAQEKDSTGCVVRSIPLGVPICYESIYPEFCTGYVQAGAKVITVITNDGWWGDTPGYRQHFSYSRLRAIELRRDVARCANTGISGIINQRGDVVTQLGWWEPEAFTSTVNLNSSKTFFAVNGDIVGRACTFMFILLLLMLVVSSFINRQ